MNYYELFILIEKLRQRLVRDDAMSPNTRIDVLYLKKGHAQIEYKKEGEKVKTVVINVTKEDLLNNIF